MERTIYDVILNINGQTLTKIIIDPHYREKHQSHINDQLIIELVFSLNNKVFEPDKISLNGYEFYSQDKIEHYGKLYKLIWTLKKGEDFFGVINCYRRK